MFDVVVGVRTCGIDRFVVIPVVPLHVVSTDDSLMDARVDADVRFEGTIFWD